MDFPNLSTHGERIHYLRKLKCLSQAELGALLGVSQSAVRQWEGGLSNPRPRKLKAIYELFQVDIDLLEAALAPTTPPSHGCVTVAPVVAETSKFTSDFLNGLSPLHLATFLSLRELILAKALSNVECLQLLSAWEAKLEQVRV